MAEDLVLIVDDEIAKRENSQEDFIELIGVPAESSLFAENYEEALEIIKLKPNIVFCFIDIKIPKNRDEQYDYTADESEWGLKLIPQINNIKMFIYSAYVDQIILQEKAEQNDLIIGSGHKPFLVEEFKKAVDYLNDIFVPISPVSLVRESFDYSSLDDELSNFMRAKAQTISTTYRKTIEDLIHVGSYLLEVKERLEYGQFYKWIDAELPFGEASAIRFMQAAKRFSSYNLQGLDLVPSALYKLAEAAVAPEAAEEAIERARRGEKITNIVAQELKKKYSLPKKSKTADKSNQGKLLSVSPSVEIAQQALEPSPQQINKPKQKILAVVPSQNAIQNSWWQLGEHHRLFCGEAKNREFIKHLPKKIDLMLNFLPKQDFSLIPAIKSNFSFTLESNYDDLDLDPLVKECIRSTTQPGEIVVFNYIYYAELLDLAERLKCHFIVAEPDLAKCERILTIWREKGAVMRLTS